MNRREFWGLWAISDVELEATLCGLLGAGARVEARIVAHLAEVEKRRLHLLAGYPSLYDYCRKRLGLSEFEAFTRIAAARVAGKYPVVFEMLERRQLHLTAICEVREFLTVENHRELLEVVSGKTKLQIREVLAQRFPQADVPARLQKLPALEPLSPGRYLLQLTLSAEQKAKLEQARDLLSHANSSGDLAIVVERALDQLISRLEKRRFGGARPAQAAAEASAATKEQAPARRKSAGVGHAGERARAPHLASSSELVAEARDGGADGSKVAGAIESKGERRKHIASATRRDLLARGDVRCGYVSHDGQLCEGRAFLQLHHRRAWAHGGSDTADNLELLCGAHNRLLAEQAFGRAHIEAAIAARKLEEPA